MEIDKKLYKYIQTLFVLSTNLIWIYTLVYGPLDYNSISK